MKDLILLILILVSSRAMALQSLDDSALRKVSGGQYGFQVDIKNPSNFLISNDNVINIEIAMLQNTIPFSATVTLTNIQWPTGHNGGSFNITPQSTGGPTITVPLPISVGSIEFKDICLGTNTGPILGSLSLVGIVNHGSTMSLSIK